MNSHFHYSSPERSHPTQSFTVVLKFIVRIHKHPPCKSRRRHPAREQQERGGGCSVVTPCCLPPPTLPMSPADAKFHNIAFTSDTSLAASPRLPPTLLTNQWIQGFHDPFLRFENLPEWLRELRNHQTQEIHRARYSLWGGSHSSHALPLQCTTLLAPGSGHEPRSSLNSVNQGVLWRFYYLGMVEWITGHWWVAQSPAPLLLHSQKLRVGEGLKAPAL